MSVSDKMPSGEPNSISSSPSGASRGTRIVLAVSLAANLAVGGFVLGRILDGDGPGHRGMGRDLAFGPLTEALNPEDRQTIARMLFQNAPKMRDARSAMREDLELILAALLAEPFESSALDAAFAAQNLRMNESMGLAQRAIRDFMVQMPSQDRIAFALRLQNSLSRDSKN